jgi:hypothetical protein
VLETLMYNGSTPSIAVPDRMEATRDSSAASVQRFEGTGGSDVPEGPGLDSAAAGGGGSVANAVRGTRG